MEEIKNENINEESSAEIVESEEVLEVALADDGEEAAPESKNENAFEYTDGEMSGLTETQRRRKMIFDKITTGILIALLASPVAIILYIFLWFIFR
ncbi:MAG: hypothetical protein IJY23_00340 [Clostridia bacterium]|nr:hypothetical protein [Clostridia bacterium]